MLDWGVGQIASASLMRHNRIQMVPALRLPAGVNASYISYDAHQVISAASCQSTYRGAVRQVSTFRSLLGTKEYSESFCCLRELYHMPAVCLCLLSYWWRCCSCSERFLKDRRSINPMSCGQRLGSCGLLVQLWHDCDSRRFCKRQSIGNYSLNKAACREKSL